MKKRLSLILLLTVLVLSFAWQFIVAQDSQTLTVFAATSVTDAFTKIGEDFKADHAGVDITFNFGGSSALATQLTEGGAPADIFASANAKQMQVAVDGKRIAGKPVTFVKNRLVLIVPADNPAGIQSLHDLANDGVKLVVAAAGVPVRDYTDAMLEKLAADPLYGEDYKTAFTANIVSEEENVRQVSAKVALGEADAGIVYRSDITPDIKDKVLALPIPDSINTLATYPIAVTNDSANPDLAKAFIDYIVSDTGQDTLVKWNFISVRIPELAYSVTLAHDGKLHVEGQIFNPLALTVDDLRDNYTAKTMDVTYKSGDDTVSTTYTGALLWDILNNAQANFNADVKNDKLSMFIVATGSDGYQAVIAWGEIDPDFGNQPILIAYDENGAPIAEGAVRLIVPGDAHGGRYVSSLVNLSLHDAPPVAKQAAQIGYLIDRL
jgi:molybdate transport system substrate-binding protein